ncbi:MAG TPA: hypothetical protein VKV04_15435 [Verrucomicrobiae bacterium]|nr:hypothetical protein [Verrucomicrobiae bacterium]
MPITLEIIRASEFVRVDTTEHLNFDASKNVLQGLALACRKRGLDRAMLDLRAVPPPAKPLYTPTQLAALIGAFREAGFSRHQRLAVLFRNDVHGGIRTFAFLSKMRGLDVEAFDDFERALHWLSGGVEEEHPGVPIPIAKRETKKRVEVSNTRTRGLAAVPRFHGADRDS